MKRLPEELDVDWYIARYPDLNKHTIQQAIAHYQSHGIIEGRAGNCLEERQHFVGLIDDNDTVLEIGPFVNPILRGKQVKYVDVLDGQGLYERALKIGRSVDTVPYIDYVIDDMDLSKVDSQFDIVISSHCIEHQPDLVDHLDSVSNLLSDEGRYFLLIPDMRFCFDRFQNASTIADVLDANQSKRRRHTLKSVIEHRALTTHNDSLVHWKTYINCPNQQHPTICTNAINLAIDEYKNIGSAYLDVHAWYFTPYTFERIISILFNIKKIKLSVERLYQTRYGTNEFWVILKKCNDHM